MLELETGLVDGDGLNFNQSFLKFNVTKKVKTKGYSQFHFKCWILDTASLSSKFIAIINANFTKAFLSEKNNFFENVKSILWGIPL